MQILREEIEPPRTSKVPLGTKLLHTVFFFFFSFWGIIFGNYYWKLYSMIFLGKLITVM